MELVLASRNRDKIGEIRHILNGISVTIWTFLDFPGFPEVEEVGDTLAENALLKAQAICDYTGKPALADDSGLEVDALGGAPGVYSARYAGIDVTYEDNNKKLLRELEGVPEEARTARFRCVLALVEPGGTRRTVEGVCEGHIVGGTRGTGGFGYDPLFVPEGETRTFAEMPAAQKNRISHRYRALKQARELLQTREVEGGGGNHG